MSKKLILIDGSGLIYRGFYAIPPFFKSPAGVQTNAVFGFTNILLSLIANKKPDYIAVAYDLKGPTFRHKAYEAYKATRVKAPQELYDQIPLVKNVVAAFRIPSFGVEGFEADDIIATIVNLLKAHADIELLIATGDFDLFQLASDQVSILTPGKSFKDPVILTVADIEKKYALKPTQIVDYKGLAGDGSDNIPGVKGIGDKGATALLATYQNLENIYAHLPELSETVRKKLEASRENAFMSKNLATLRTDVPLKFDLSACKVTDFDVSTARKTFSELGFKSLLRKLDELYGSEKKDGNAVVQGSLF